MHLLMHLSLHLIKVIMDILFKNRFKKNYNLQENISSVALEHSYFRSNHCREERFISLSFDLCSFELKSKSLS